MNVQLQFGVFFVCKFLMIGVLFLAISAPADTEVSVAEMSGIFTAYNATVSQTDSTPTITASNKKVTDGIVANNCLPFGTKIKVNDRVFEIQDRMNKRYGCKNFDIYMHEYDDAVTFGKQTLKYEII
jgi:3D (Asp-Asp-Asp) domain-containing protein